MLLKFGLTSLPLHLSLLYHSPLSLLILSSTAPISFSSVSSFSSPFRGPSLDSLAATKGVPCQDLWFREGKKKKKMNSYNYYGYGYQEKNTLTSCEEMRVETMICPKPRRLGLINHSSSINTHIRPLRHTISWQSEVEDSGVGAEAELLDIILPKQNCYLERSGGQVVAASPPFFCGSPPSRASNPVIQDEQFGNENFSPFTETSSSSARGCVPMKFGNTPAARIEGFDCLNRDRRSCSISAVA